MKKFLTVKQIKHICSKNKYILVRYSDGKLIGINCHASKIAIKKRDYKDHENTLIIGVQPCGFNEYISCKIPFL